MEAHRLQAQRPSTVGVLALIATCLPISVSASFEAARPDIYEFSSDWFLAGTAIPTYQGIVLSPGRPGRGAYMFKLSTLDTDDFELSTSFHVAKPATRTVQNDGFAIWYVADNATEELAALAKDHAHKQEEIVDGTWGREFLNKEFDLFGYKSKYKGLGIFFVDGDKASVSAIVNDGTKQVRLGQEVPAADATKLSFTEGMDISLKLRVQPKEATLEVVGHGTIKLPAPLTGKGYIGVSAFTGSKDPVVHESSARSCTFMIKTYEIHNKDPNAKPATKDIGAIPKAEATKKSAEEMTDMLHETSSHKDHREVSDAIKDLTNMVFKLVVESQPMRNQMQRAIESLGQRIDVMEKSFTSLKSELDRKSGHHLMEEFDSIKQELTSLSNVASKETFERHQKLESLHSDIADVHKSAHSPDQIDKHLDKLTQSNSKVLDKLTSEHQMMFGVSIAAIAFIVIAGLSLYNKFRCWEKKHIL